MSRPRRGSDLVCPPSLSSTPHIRVRRLMNSYTTYVIDDAAETYANAYFELNYINVFSTSSSSSSSSASVSTTTAAGGGSRSSATGATTTVSTGPGVSQTPVRAGNGATSRAGAGLGGLIGIAGLLALGLGL
jgi:hypothetical protein